ncbi:MAG: SulP family inorganic anion transporter [Hyphomicrobiaceae bacterium]
MDSTLSGGTPHRSPVSHYWRLFIPKLVIALREGYGAERFQRDAIAGITVAILALPLSMAIAIGAGMTPDKGLVTSVVAGLLISALGGSRFQIGGPAAAFIVVIAHIVHDHGTAGLMTATFLAGLVLLIAGFAKLGTYVKYVPGPVIIGFTSGIGVLILVGQVKDFLGLRGELPADFIPRLGALWDIRGTFNAAAFAVALGTLTVILLLKRYLPRWPGLLIAVVGASAVAALLSLPVETIQTRFGGLPTSLPAPTLPDLSWSRITAILPTALTLAFLIGVESLLSAVAADTMAGTRHRSNVEVVAQGVANMASPLFGGLPATGVIARTGTNITAGAATPVSGVLHAVFVLAFMLLAAPLASHLALPCLAAVLVSVAWRLLEWREVKAFLTRAPNDDRIILVVTLLLTVLVDLNTAIATGVVLAAMLFMHRMAELPGIDLGGRSVIDEDRDDLDPDRPPTSQIMNMELPDAIRVVQFSGPLFFGAAANVSAKLTTLETWPKVLILRMREVPLIDATAISTLESLARTCEKHGCRIIMSGLQRQPRAALSRFGFFQHFSVTEASNSYVALEKAKALTARG